MRLTKRSKEYIAEIFGQYAEVETLPKVFTEKLIVHMYATGDTKDNGYCDALWFTAKIFDTKNKTVYTVKQRDAINFDDVRPSSIRIFKDGSTCVTLHGPVKVEIFQALHISKA